MLREGGIEEGFAGEEVASGKAVEAGVEEDGMRTASRWRILRIDGWLVLLVR